MAFPDSPWIVKPLVPEPVYTDRAEYLEDFYAWAIAGAKRRTMSTVMLGKRRMGKTEIFKRVVNRLFFEQDPKSPEAVVPVYFSFPDSGIDRETFARKYIENFLRYYAAFYLRRPDIVRREMETDLLLSIIEENRDGFPHSDGLETALMKHRTVMEGKSVIPHQTALECPRRVADIEDSTIAVFLDEFQNTRLPQYDFDIVGFMQEAVESPTCPHFVTGSAMSILSREIIGRGALFGRFRGKEIRPMSLYWGKELALNAAAYLDAAVSEPMAPVIAQRCGGNPFYITAVIQQAVELNRSIVSEADLNHILAVDLSSGFIWGELNDQVMRWIERINEHGITKWALYLSALDENTDEAHQCRLDVDRIQKEIERREGRKVTLETIRDVLIKLSRGDLIEYLELGDGFRRVDDPILLEFLRIWGKIEVEGHDRNQVGYDLEARYRKMDRRFAEYKGYLAEVHMSQVLLNGQGRTLPGGYFHSEADIRMPQRFVYVENRKRLGSGSGREIDVIGASAETVWVCQSKWVQERRIGIADVKALMAQGDAVNADMDPNGLQLWIFAHDGLTADAAEFARENGIFWSSRNDFDGLLRHLGLRPLPDL